MAENTNDSTGQPMGAEPTAETQPTVKEMMRRVNAGTKKWQDQFKEIRRVRKFVAGDRVKDPLSGFFEADLAEGKGKFHQANIVYATLQALLPLLYARDPDTAVRPSQHVEPATDQYAQAGKFSDTLELVLNRTFDDAQLKGVAKQSIRETLISSVALTKVSYQTDFYRDPLIQNRMDDLQEKLATARSRTQAIQEDELDQDEEDTQTELLKNQIDALQDQVSVIKAEGLVIDPLPIEDYRMDPQIDTLQRYREARWQAHVTWMTLDKIRTTFALDDKEMKQLHKFKRTIGGIPERMGEDNAAQNQGDEDVAHRPEVCPIWELWDKDTSTVYTWGEGGENWLRDPWQPERMGKRWYPFFMLAFNWRDNSIEWPISDASLMENLGREYDVIRKQAYEHRKLSKPHYVTDSSAVGDRKDVESFAVAGLGDVTMINAGGRPVNEMFQAAVPPPYNPQIYDTTQIRTDIEWISGIGDAQRGGVLRQKTATEATIQQQGLTGRMDEKRDALEDWLSEMAVFAAEILIQSMSMQEVMRIAGPNAFWPQMDRETLYTMVEVKIRSGSTGKPDQQQNLDQWINLLPMIEQNVQRIMQMRAEGVPDKENVWIQMLQETLKRTDESIDLEKFLPGDPVEDQQPDPHMLGNIGPEGMSPEELREQEIQAQQQGGPGQQGPDPAAAQAEQQAAQQQQQMQQQADQMALQEKQQKMQHDQQSAQLDIMAKQTKIQQDQELHQAKMQGLGAKSQIDIQAAMQKMEIEDEKADVAIESAERDMKRKDKTAAAQAKAANKPKPKTKE